MKLSSICSFVLAASASAATFTINPTEDAFVSSAHPNSSYGTAGQVSVAAGALAKGEFDSLLKFDFGPVVDSLNSTYGANLWSIESITLTLTNTAPNNPLFNGNQAGPGSSNVNFSGLFSIQWMMNDGWIQGTGNPSAPGADGIMYSTLASYRSAADETLGTYAYTAATTGSNVWTLGLTSGFLADASAGNKVSFLALPGDNGVAFGANAVEFGTPANRPVLTIVAQAAPEPQAGLLLGGAVLGLLSLRRRHGRAA